MEIRSTSETEGLEMNAGDMLSESEHAYSNGLVVVQFGKQKLLVKIVGLNPDGELSVWRGIVCGKNGGEREAIKAALCK